ncbi:MAG TPA: phospholipase D-like domain-containing protein [Ramlibacter sp.]|nr:phospholipase D-like domain-containing protein [Ramlibacter sp.]
MFSNLAVTQLLTVHGLVTVAAVLLYAITSHVKQQRRHPTAAIAWILFILLVPYLALPAFLTFGSRKLEHRQSTAVPQPAAHGSEAWAIDTILALGQPSPSAYTALDVHKDGIESRDALLATLDGALHSIDVCTFILGRDSLGEAVVDRLCEKARSGLRVRLLLDGLGSLMGGRPRLKRFTEAGGVYTMFVPPFRSPLKGRFNLREHRKLVVADVDSESGRLWCGGRNLAAEYFVSEPGAPCWKDLTFDVRGPLVRQAGDLFVRDWAFANGQGIGAQVSVPPLAPYPLDGAQLVASGPDQPDDTIYALLITAAYRARRRIALVTPYFVPDSALLMALRLAAMRGVAVDLLLPGRSNHRLSDLARSRALRTLAQAGVRIWLAPDMLHAKLALIDDTLALAGSANFDSRSLFLNYELMVAFHNTSDVLRFAAWFENERRSARPYVPAQPGLVRDVADGLLLWMAFQL